MAYANPRFAPGGFQCRLIAFAMGLLHGANVLPSDLPLLSIVIVSYKSRDEIEPCLASLPSTLDGRPVEVMVIDNSTGDGTAEAIRARFPDVIYCAPEENLGFGRANNLGYARTRGEWVLFLNPDTVCNRKALAHCIHRLKLDPSIGLISPKLVQADGAMDLACRRSIPSLWDGLCRATGLAARFPQRAAFAGYNLTHLAVAGTYDVGAINGAFMLGSRRVFDAVVVNGAVFDERFFMYGDDLDLCIRVAQAGFRVVYDGSVEILHLKGMSVARDFSQMSQAIFDANRDVYLKHFNPRDSTLVRWKYSLAFGAWKQFSRWRSRFRGHRRVRPL